MMVEDCKLRLLVFAASRTMAFEIDYELGDGGRTHARNWVGFLITRLWRVAHHVKRQASVSVLALWLVWIDHF
jgi:hypothetical protein